MKRPLFETVNVRNIKAIVKLGLDTGNTLAKFILGNTEFIFSIAQSV